MIGSFHGVAKWYGAVIGLNDATIDIEPGITGLLGPNGAGKSTFLKLLGGQLSPSQGQVRLLDTDPFADPSVHRRVGFLPEQDAFYDNLTGREFVRFLTRLHGISGSDATRLTGIAIDRVGLNDVADRKVKTYSKGMRQRIKLAQAIAHEPDVLVLDEPLTGMDPVARRRTIDLVRELAAAGATVMISSHILHEVQEMTKTVILLYQGRVRASGTSDDIRGYLNRYPHKIRIRSSEPRGVSRALLALPGVVGVRLETDSVRIETHAPDELYDRLTGLVLEDGLPIEGIDAEDVGLDAIFEYLVS